MCAESLETPADGEAALVLHLVYGFEHACQGLHGGIGGGDGDGILVGDRDGIGDGGGGGGGRRAARLLGDGRRVPPDGRSAAVCARPRRFSMRAQRRDAAEAECECDLAQLMAEAPSDAIQEVVVPCTEVGGQRTLCRLWVRLFRARSRGAARLEYEIACLGAAEGGGAAGGRPAGGGAEEGHLRPRHAAESIRFRA